MNPFAHLRSQVKACLEREAKLPPAERRKHQWMFFATVGEITYIVGKGGANTMFYRIGEKDERNICTPHEMLDIISGWGKSKFTAYLIGRKPNKLTHGPFQTLDDALEVMDAPIGSYLIGVKHDNSFVRLYKLKSGLMDNKWVAFKK